MMKYTEKMNLKRRDLLKTSIGLSLAGGFSLASPIAAAAENAVKYKWDMATLVPEGTQFFDMSVVFAENVRRITGGAIEIEPYAGGVLAPSSEAYNAPNDGASDIAHGFAAYLVNQDPTNALFAGHAGGMAPDAFIHWFYEGGGKELLEEFRRETMGVHPLIVGIGPTEVFANSHVPIQTREDLKGLKHRTVGAWANILEERFDGAPVTVPGSEVYTMLDRKAIDSTEWSTPGENYTAGFHETAEYIIVPGIHQPAYMFDVVLPVDTWDGLSEDEKAQLEQAALLSTHQIYLTQGQRDMEAMRKWRESERNTVLELDNELINEIRDAGREWVMSEAEKEAQKGNDWMQRVAESYYTYKDRWQQDSVYRVKEG